MAVCLVMLFPEQNFSDQLAAIVHRRFDRVLFEPGPVAGFSLPMNLKYKESRLAWSDLVAFSPEGLSIGIRPASLFRPVKDLVFRGQSGQSAIKGEIRDVFSTGEGSLGFILEIENLPVRELKRRIGGYETGIDFDISGLMERGGDKFSGQMRLDGLTADLKSHPQLSEAGIDKIAFDRLDLAFTIETEKMTITTCRGTGPSFSVTVTGSVDLRPKGIIDLEGELNPTPSMVSKLSRVADVQHLFAASGKTAGIPIKISGTLNDPRVRFR